MPGDETAKPAGGGGRGLGADTGPVVVHRCGTLALPRLIRKGSERDECELHPKVTEEVNLGK